MEGRDKRGECTTEMSASLYHEPSESPRRFDRHGATAWGKLTMDLRGGEPGGVCGQAPLTPPDALPNAVGLRASLRQTDPGATRRVRGGGGGVNSGKLEKLRREELWWKLLRSEGVEATQGNLAPQSSEYLS